jgi:hypothetical protein
MNMRQVGYTAEGSNLAYVSHWQTWLQGSDYDIDKAYIMGLAFDDNGQYIGWSSLFDYNSLYKSPLIYIFYRELKFPLKKQKTLEFLLKLI